MKERAEKTGKELFLEGACKNLIGKRLKQTGARWRIRRLNRMAILCSIRYSDQWKLYWKTAK